jgi:hypothetical protein
MQAPERLTPEQLSELAVDVVEGRSYVASDPDAIRNSFGLLIAMLDWDDVADQVGALYAPMSEAMPTAINGMPVFASMQILHVDDLEPLATTVMRYEIERKSFIGGARQYLVTEYPEDPRKKVHVPGRTIFEAVNPLDALDQYAVAKGYGRYSDMEPHDLAGMIGADEKGVWAVFENCTLWAIPFPRKEES